MSGGDETVNRDCSFVCLYLKKKVILLIVLTVIKYCCVEQFFLLDLYNNLRLLSLISSCKDSLLSFCGRSSLRLS